VNPEQRVVDVKSPTFRIGRGSDVTDIKSSVEVMPNAALAARGFAAVRSARGQSCLARSLTDLIVAAARRGSRLAPVAISRLPDPLPAGQDSFGVRVTTSLITDVAGKQTRLPVELDVFSILSGPAEVNLTSTGSRSPSAASERRLLELLYTRAQAHKL
jgi:hypothetical protein